MSKGKKNWLMILIYAGLIAMCLGIVWFVGKISSPTKPGRESSSETTMVQTGESQEEEREEEESESAEATPSEAETQEESRQQDESGRWYGGRTETVRPEIEEELPVEEYRPPSIVTVSDIHYFAPSMTDYGEAFGEMVERDDGKLVPYISQLMDVFTEEMTETRPDAVILSGDLTLNGEKGAHEALAEKLKMLADQGVRVLVIPGNHDINNPNAASYFGAVREAAESVSAEEFLDIYHEFGYDQAISRDETSLSYICELDEKNWLMMLDSAQYEPVNLVGGRIRSTTVKWMEELLEAAKELGISVIPIAHHNLLKESILYPVDCTLENSDEVIKLLERYRVPVFISGHLHLQRTKKYKPEPGEPEDAYHISEIVADSFAIPPCQYGILSWGDGGQLRYTTKEADVERYAAAHGLTDENLLNFKEYGTDFLVGVISQQIYKKMSSLPEEQMRGMAELYGQLNRDYCAGTPIDVKEIKSDEAFRLWERNLPDSRMFEEIDDILRDTRKDHNTWVFPGEW